MGYLRLSDEAKAAYEVLQAARKESFVARGANAAQAMEAANRAWEAWVKARDARPFDEPPVDLNAVANTDEERR